MSQYFILQRKPSLEAEDVEGYMEIEDWVGTYSCAHAATYPRRTSP